MCVCVCVIVVMGTVVFWVWKVHLRVKLPICILEAPGLNPDLDTYCPDGWFSLVFSVPPGKCWRGTSVWATKNFFFFHFAIYFSLCRITSRFLATDFVVTYTINVHRQHVQFSLFSPTECNSSSWFAVAYGKCRREELVPAQLVKLFVFIIRNVMQTHQLTLIVLMWRIGWAHNNARK